MQGYDKKKYLAKIIFTYILMSAVYYGNLWDAKKFPFMSQAIFVSCGTIPAEQRTDSGTGPGREPVQPDRTPDQWQI